MPVGQPRPEKRAPRKTAPAEKLKPCKFCGEDILASARKCEFCNELQRDADRPEVKGARLRAQAPGVVRTMLMLFLLGVVGPALIALLINGVFLHGSK